MRVAGVCNDTRRLEAGDLFVAVPGARSDGLQHVAEAVRRGASALMAQAEPPGDLGVPLILVPAARPALADVAAAFFEHPSRKVPVIGVTGTDGKTSTTQLVSAILEAAGMRTGWLTTVNTKIGDALSPNAADFTTPEAPLVQGTLARMRDAGVDVAILETSSHALALDRVRAVAYQVGVFTNLSPEHLNFHGTFSAYRDAKRLLFERLPPEGLAVLNADDPSCGAMRTATRGGVRTYGMEQRADLRATDVHLSPSGTRFILHPPNGAATPIETHLVGRFNVSNWLAAYAAAIHFGATPEHVVQAATRQAPVPGRMNLIRQGQPFAVVVDFAHTPQALEKALDTVRGLSSGRVLLVFGLAGGRDAHHRAIMGALAIRKADFTVITQDDPYDEDPMEIAAQIAAGASEAGGEPDASYAIQIDRFRAIERVLRMAGPNDVVLLAGKGHETRMMVGHQRLPWNDAEAAGIVLGQMGFGP